jgi:superfamily II DNA/RNA helicase
MKEILEELINCETDLKRIATTKINRLMLHVPQKFIRTNAEKRMELLVETLRKDLKADGKRTVMIFSHRTKTAEFVARYLEEQGIECDLLINRLNDMQRQGVVSRFFNGEVRVLCCTDIASRGWNTLNVNHVINFEMPPFVADYLHRCGRVGRLGGGGGGGRTSLVTNFVTKKFEVDLVMNIERSLRTGVELENVNANVKRALTHMFEAKEAVKRRPGPDESDRNSGKNATQGDDDEDEEKEDEKEEDENGLSDDEKAEDGEKEEIETKNIRRMSGK